MLLAASLDTAVYEPDSTPEVILSAPVTVTLATAPPTTVTLRLPDTPGLRLDVAVIITVPAVPPVNLSPLSVAVPVPSVSLQV